MGLLVPAPQAKAFQNSGSQKFRPSNFTSPKEHHHLQSESLGSLFLHLSTMLNRSVASVCR
jgi:hypothetical protein